MWYGAFQPPQCIAPGLSRGPVQVSRRHTHNPANGDCASFAASWSGAQATALASTSLEFGLGLGNARLQVPPDFVSRYLGLFPRVATGLLQLLHFFGRRTLFGA